MGIVERERQRNKNHGKKIILGENYFTCSFDNISNHVYLLCPHSRHTKFINAIFLRVGGDDTN